MKKKKAMAVLLMIVLIIACAAIGFLMYREHVFATRTIKEKVDIGGYGLYISCIGKGSPAVIFESGLGESGNYWRKVQTEVSSVARTVRYDRAGLGASDTSKLERTSLNQIKELHLLLETAKIKGPYIIVAHSMGGYNARLFAATYPKEVAGIVFVDSSHENQFDYIKNLEAKEVESIRNDLVKYEQNLDNIFKSADQVKEARKSDAIRNIPITVLTADRRGHTDYPGGLNAWFKFQDDIASLSDKSKHIVIKDCGHSVPVEKPFAIIDAVKEMIADIRK